ncbi:hypothetical protein GPECTOR_12g409 [Gonium pectorale]|uniref:Uncharacterized protein n=1 Tax=Gonium pectorale TaxID=33097 RepID=A0A150GNL0_GONPE|nr:hypothetical protein GPECTOR_12g409 [Gonium pectorale]|eukprot:KXZ51446.1 hypothetical protein GPECTOR_12g409 [Gonium pectorale]
MALQLLIGHEQTHRLELQRIELQVDKERIMREKQELQIANLQAQNEAQVAKAAAADAWEVTNLKLALRRQAAQHETRLACLKRRTRALLTAVLPAGHGRSAGGLGQPGPAAAAASTPGGFHSAPGSPTAASPLLPDLWDAPLHVPPTLEAGAQPDVHAQVRQIVGWLYDDTISEDQALEQMTALTQSLSLQAPRAPAQAAAESRGCSPLPALHFGGSDEAAEDGGAAAHMVDAGTDPQTCRERIMADVATETPAELSYVGSPRDTASATPADVASTPARRLGPAVPVLDLAALVAQAMEAAPLSGRSTASTTAAGSYTQSSNSFNAFSDFVLAQPEKLQRLIMRHAAATGAIGRQQHSPLPSGLLSSTAAGATPVPEYASAASATAAGLTMPSGAGLADIPSMMPHSSGAFSARPSFTSRLLGLGTSSNVNRPPAPASAAPAPASTGAAGVVMPAAAPAAPAADGPKPVAPTAPKRSTAAPNVALPKFANLEAGSGGLAPPPAAATAPAAPAAGVGRGFPQLLMPTLPSVKPVSPELRGLGAGGVFTGRSPTELDADFKDVFGADSSSSALALGRLGSAAR